MIKKVRSISEILPEDGILEILGSTEAKVYSLCLDSRLVSAGSLFFAQKGTVADGHGFIRKSIGQGAVAIVCEVLPETVLPGITYIRVRDSIRATGLMASAFYDHPSRQLNLTGITGTNGKTTTATLLYRVFREAGYSTGLISTIQYQVNDEILPATHTTPDPIRINEMLAKMVQAGCTHCFMEVSSHAIDQKRIAGLSFAGGVFTNITHDHLDYHKTFSEYLKAKKTFFDELSSDAFALTNKDDRNGQVMVQNTGAKVYSYSLRSIADFHCRIIENDFEGLHLSIDGTECWFHLVGSFNAYNILAVYATSVLLGLDKEKSLEILSRQKPVDGRFNSLRSAEGVTAIVDYAHTPDALKNVLETINAIRTGNEQLITVVGAGGNRDAGKRPLMAKIACSLSSKVILTSDNPRNEEPEQIIAEMKKGVEPEDRNKVVSIVNRKEAIRAACAMARAGDILLVAGKGHETYQEIKGVKYPFDDKKVIKEMLKTEM